MNAPTGIINIRGKDYQTVALRVHTFRERHPDYALITSVVARDADCVVMQASISDASGRVLATGHAEEYRASSQINRTSALENAETSAIGRALAALGIGGTEFASADEVANAIHQQGNGRASQGHSQGGAVSPVEPAEWGVRPKGEGPTKTELDRVLKNMIHEIEGCGDEDMLSAYTSTDEYKAGKALLEEYRPSALLGPAPASMPEFVPVRELISRKVKAWRAANVEPPVF